VCALGGSRRLRELGGEVEEHGPKVRLGSALVDLTVDLTAEIVATAPEGAAHAQVAPSPYERCDLQVDVEHHEGRARVLGLHPHREDQRVVALARLADVDDRRRAEATARDRPFHDPGSAGAYARQQRRAGNVDRKEIVDEHGDLDLR
jgi:hypothetical protein